MCNPSLTEMSLCGTWLCNALSGGTLWIYDVLAFNVLSLKCCLKIFAPCLLQYSENKSYCEDLTEGKFSFPVIYAIKSHPDGNQVLRILLLFQICSLAYTLWLWYLATCSLVHISSSSYSIQLNLKLYCQHIQMSCIYAEILNNCFWRCLIWTHWSCTLIF